MIDDSLKQRIEETRAKHEFLTFLVLKDDAGWKCGVVQNSNNRFITFYDLSKIRDEKMLARFMAHADKWWWESGMSLPIDAFIGNEFDEFRDILSTLPKKSMDGDAIGPVYSITEHYLKRVKKRRIELVNRRKG